MTRKKLNHTQTALLEALLLTNELINNLTGEMQEGLSIFLEDTQEDLGLTFDETVTKLLEQLGVNTQAMISKFARFFELPTDKLRDKDFETLLARKNAEYCSEGGVDGVAANYSPADLGVLAWKLADRLRYLYTETFEAEPSEPPYVVELKLE